MPSEFSAHKPVWLAVNARTGEPFEIVTNPGVTDDLRRSGVGGGGVRPSIPAGGRRPVARGRRDGARPTDADRQRLLRWRDRADQVRVADGGRAMKPEPTLSGTVAVTDLHPRLRLTLYAAEGRTDGYDIWTCRECGAPTGLVLVVPYDGTWKHAVHPLCIEHYPSEHLDRPLCTDGWPGPATPTRKAARS